MARYEFLVLSCPHTGEDAEFNRWYSQEHVPDVLAVPGVIAARRLRIAEGPPQVGTLPQWSYVAIYTIASAHPERVLEEIRARAGTRQMVISSTLDRSKTATFLLEDIDADVTRAQGSH